MVSWISQPLTRSAFCAAGQLVRRSSVASGQLPHRVDVDILRRRGQPVQCHVVDESGSQFGRHDESPMMWVRKGPLQRGAHTIEDRPKRNAGCGIRLGKKTLRYAEKADFRIAQEVANLPRISQSRRRTHRATLLTYPRSPISNYRAAISSNVRKCARRKTVGGSLGSQDWSIAIADIPHLG